MHSWPLCYRSTRKAHTQLQDSPPQHQASLQAKLERVRPPTISAAGSSEDWSYFLTCWDDYVGATNVTGKDKVIQLLKCCDEQLRKDLARNAGGSLTDKSATEVMEAIKKVAMQEENTMVAECNLTTCARTRTKRSAVLAPVFADKRLQVPSHLPWLQCRS